MAKASPKDPWEGPRVFLSSNPLGGRITAIDLNSGNHLWMIPNSATPDWATNSSALAGIALPRTGSFDQVGMLVTKSLLFAGEGSGLYRAGGGGNRFYAYDKATGSEISELTLPANQSGVPMTYALSGRQFIVVAIGAKEHPGELIALTLP